MSSPWYAGSMVIRARRSSMRVTTSNRPRAKNVCSDVRMGSTLDSPVTLSMTVLRRTRGSAISRNASHSSADITLCRWNARGYHEMGSAQYPRARSDSASTDRAAPEPLTRESYVSPFQPIRRSSPRTTGSRRPVAEPASAASVANASATPARPARLGRTIASGRHPRAISCGEPEPRMMPRLFDAVLARDDRPQNPKPKKCTANRRIPNRATPSAAASAHLFTT